MPALGHLTLEPAHQCLKLLLVARGNYNRGAAAGKLSSNSFANTSAGAGYQDDLISETRHCQKIPHPLGECAIKRLAKFQKETIKVGLLSLFLLFDKGQAALENGDRQWTGY